MPINKTHRKGITDLLTYDPQNIPILLQMAKSVTKSVCEITDEREALDYLFAYMDDTHTLLNKRHITKELLFRYLHSRIRETSTDFTKSDLIKHVINYWNRKYQLIHTSKVVQKSSSEDAKGVAKSEQTSISNLPTQDNQQQSDSTQFPINLLARKFSEWFFDNYNKSTLKIEDFWPNVELKLRIIATDAITEDSCIDSENVIKALMASKLQFGFYFNPNITHDGVQGRMDSHGLVLVLACGTLHTQEKFVGVFECVFGLLRDPFADNNWKTKRIQLLLRSEAAAHIPSLMDSDSLRQALSLPTNCDALT